MGNRLTAVPQVEYYIQDLAGIVFLKTIGNGRLLKTICGKHNEGKVVVKVYMKRPPNNDLTEYHNKLQSSLFSLNLLISFGFY
jgi:phosphoinositide-3-kinase regulatory subunit 4